jgi:hypothetical protein
MTLYETPTPIPDGTTKTFRLSRPFADGSLRVRVDSIDQTPAVVGSDGASRTFELAFAPRSYELVTVESEAPGDHLEEG